MFRDNSIKKIFFHFPNPDFDLIRHLDEDFPSNNRELEIDILPEDLSNKSKFKTFDTYVYGYSFKVLQPEYSMVVKLRNLMARGCTAVLEDCAGNLLVIGNYNEPVTLSITEIDSKTYKNIDGIKVEITCESLVLPTPQ
ncbi:MAG: hypothetical protein ACPGSD_00035 [Flavobacteriales bacterium]